MPTIDIRLYAPLATLLAISVTLILWLLNQRRKELKYKIIKQQPVMSLRGEARKHLKILFNGKAVSDLHIVMVKIQNTGHLSINPGEYQPRLSINTGPGTKIIMSSIIETQPADLDERNSNPGNADSIVESFEENLLLIRPILLNQGDSFIIQMLVENLSEKISVGGHIQGIPEIKEMKSRHLLSPLLTQSGALIMAASMLWAEPADFFPADLGNLLPYFLFFLLGYVFLGAGLMLPRKLDSNTVNS